ncbi:flagellar basal body rod protein FlgB [Thiolapillus sp.]
MPISFDSALGIHTKALDVRARRTELLATNIANSDTPDYKARDIDFKAVLSRANDHLSSGLSRSNARHLPLSNDAESLNLLYRVPNHASLDGNTVDGQLEKAAFADNALRYQASLTFLDQKFKGLIGALKGE